MKSKKSKLTGCPEALSSQCVVWNGAEIPCLGISNGDTISEVVCDIANKVCKISKDIDVSQVDLSCLLDLCDLCPEEKNLKSIIELLLDNQCKLKDLIDSIDGSSADVAINLNLRCLKKFDDFGNEIPQDLNQTLQSLVNQVCADKTAIQSLQVKTDDLQDQIDDLPSATPYTEPSVATCLTPSRPLSVALPLVAQQVCEFQNLVGAAADITAAISQQCPNLNTLYAAVPGWELTVDTLAKSLNNLWVMACDIQSRVKNIEDNCCQVTCDDVDIKFQIVDNEDGDGVTIEFSSLYGNKVPSAFTDCGSTVAFTDKNKKTIRGAIKIAQESTSQEYDLSSLDLTDLITINLEVKLCSSSMTCFKCVEAEHMVLNGSCAACDVVITGTSGSATLFYTIGSSMNSITANVGDTVYIPKNAIDVSYITNSGDAEPDTSCLTITETQTTCYVIDWQVTATGVLADMFFDHVFLGTDEWPIGPLTYNLNATPFMPGSVTTFAEAINNLNTPKIKAVAIRSVYASGSSVHHYVILRTVGTAIPEIRIQNPSDVAPNHELYLIGEPSDCLPDEFTEIITNEAEA